MENKNEVMEDVVEVPDITSTQDEAGNDTTDWKALAEERQALAVKNQGIARRYKTKLEKSKEAPPANPVEKKEPKSELDYGEKAFLVANGVKGSDEIDLVRNVMSNTGKSLDEVIDSKYFQADLKEMREAKASAEAIPKGTKRSAQSTRDSVEYWIAKGELPPKDQRALRTQVVNARIKSEKDDNIFTDRPVMQ